MSSNANIDKYRAEIDEIDQRIISLLRKRFEFAKKIGHLKKSQKIPILNAKREKEILHKIAQKNRYDTPGGPFLKKMFILIFKESRRVQRGFDKKGKNC